MPGIYSGVGADSTTPKPAACSSARVITRAGPPASQLHLLYDGSGQAARMDHDPAAAAAARAAAAVLLDAALAGGTAARSSG